MTSQWYYFSIRGKNTVCTNNFKILKMKQRKVKRRIGRRRSSRTITFWNAVKKLSGTFKLYANYQIKLNALHKSCCALASRENYFHTGIRTSVGKVAVVSSRGSPQKGQTSESRWCSPSLLTHSATSKANAVIDHLPPATEEIRNCGLRVRKPHKEKSEQEVPAGNFHILKGRRA